MGEKVWEKGGVLAGGYGDQRKGIFIRPSNDNIL